MNDVDVERSSSYSDNDEESRATTDVEQLQQHYYSQLQKQNAENEVDLQNNTSDSWSSKKGKRFCNRGLQTWHQARRTWLSMERERTATTKKPPTIPESFRKELIQCLIDRRQFELSQGIPLSCVVNAYQEVWNENGCD
jgi:hypothetical protein